MKKNLWLRFGCFLTGYNYYLVQHSSELSSKAVKKFTSAILLIVLVWMFIAYSFATNYLHVGVFGGLLASLIAAFVVIQIERIIILSTKVNKWSIGFRITLAIVMAILGSFILDQILFKDDIELRKTQIMEERVKIAIQNSEKDIDQQVNTIDSSIFQLEQRSQKLSDDLQKNPVIVTSYTNTSVTRDNEGKRINSTNSTNKMVNENPKKRELEQINEQINILNAQKFKTIGSLDSIKANKEKDLRKSSGFIDELNILHDVITSSTIGFTVYALFFFFFLSIELFVVTIKLFDKASDYDKLVNHQTDVRMKMLERLNV
ncbi:DUF4407 domain-containing protein [Sphingobacterium sp. 1.A.5]|jgi:hypothetical protein|uniref:DUF4407 domain-containing protein n=1 Tax=Sphingobacterium sp. 1.A.5 TaxID=2044604 RepID=UPI000C0BDC73|nr:DUF4407 domain-containing protein [Sphingobacterium sp. 1.A.5]